MFLDIEKAQKLYELTENQQIEEKRAATSRLMKSTTIRRVNFSVANTGYVCIAHSANVTEVILTVTVVICSSDFCAYPLMHLNLGPIFVTFSSIAKILHR